MDYHKQEVKYVELCAVFFSTKYTLQKSWIKEAFLGHVLIFVTNVKRLKGINFITSSMAKSSN